MFPLKHLFIEEDGGLTGVLRSADEASTADALMATAKAHGISGVARVNDMVSMSYRNRDYLVLCGEDGVSVCGLTPAQAVLAIVGVEGCQLSMSGTARCNAPCKKLGGAS